MEAYRKLQLQTTMLQQRLEAAGNLKLENERLKLENERLKAAAALPQVVVHLG